MCQKQSPKASLFHPFHVRAPARVVMEMPGLSVLRGANSGA
jgi:hypothetical protein